MNKNFLNLSVVLAISFLYSTVAFALFDQGTLLKFRASESGSMTELSTQERTIVKGDSDVEFELKAPTIVNLDGRVPMLLIPVQAGTSDVRINPPTYREAAGDTAQAEISRVVSELMAGIHGVQKDIQNKSYDRAASKVEELQKKYPRVPFLDFVHGSVLFLQGQKARARTAVSRAMQAHPNFQEGKDFLKALGGPVKEQEEKEQEEKSGE